jgi:serine/threonine protein phosphatase PrpC
MRIDSSGLSDVGRKRDHNEDAFVLDEQASLFAVADGMGGHAAGEVASQIAIKTIYDFIHATRDDAEATWPYDYDPSLSVNGNRLRTAIRLANQRIAETIQKKEELKDMGTTVVCVLVSGDGTATVGHVGDSRAYLLRDGTLVQLTSDHSWVNEQVKLGFLDRNDAMRHPFRNVVTRALGSRGEVAVDLSEQALRPGDLLLLCSDGLNSMVDDEGIAAAIVGQGDDLPAQCRALIAAANARGGDDNITAILVRARG